MQKLKDYFLKMFFTGKGFYESKVVPLIYKTSGPAQVVLIVLAAIAILGIAICAILGLIFLVFFLVGFLWGTALWFIWTYCGLGVAYFPNLDPRWLYIPYVHFVLGSSAVVMVIRLIRPRVTVQSPSKS